MNFDITEEEKKELFSDPKAFLAKLDNTINNFRAAYTEDAVREANSWLNANAPKSVNELLSNFRSIVENAIKHKIALLELFDWYNAKTIKTLRDNSRDLLMVMIKSFFLGLFAGGLFVLGIQYINRM